MYSYMMYQKKGNPDEILYYPGDFVTKVKQINSQSD